MEKQYAIYSRKSRFTGKGESIENQVELCRRYIAQQDGETAADQAVIFEDEGFSGGTLQRPQFQMLRKQAREGRFSVLVCYRLDRISRSISDFANLIEELHDMGVAFVSIKEQFDTESPLGRAMMYIASVFSQLERETIAERIRDNLHELAKTGRWLGGVTPTGYASEEVRQVTLEGKVRRSCKLTLVPEEGNLVRLIFHTFLETGSLSQTDTYLLQHGYESKNGKRFSRFTIKGILMNPVYLTADEAAYQYLTQEKAELFSKPEEFDGKHGMMVYNRTLQRPGKAQKMRDITQWIVSVGKHDGLISGEEWVRTQQLLAQNRDKGYRKPRSHVALLSGLLRCGACGDYMRPKLTQREEVGGERVYTYLCSTKERSRGACCQMPSVSGNLLDRGIRNVLKQLPEDFPEFCRQLEKRSKNLLSQVTGKEEEHDILEQQLTEKRREIEALVSTLARGEGTAAESYIMEQIEKLHIQVENGRRQLAEWQAQMQSGALPEEKLQYLGENIASFPGVIERMSLEQQKRVVRAVVKTVVWDGETATVHLLGETDVGKVLKWETWLDVPLGENSK